MNRQMSLEISHSRTDDTTGRTGLRPGNLAPEGFPRRHPAYRGPRIGAFRRLLPEGGPLAAATLLARSTPVAGVASPRIALPSALHRACLAAKIAAEDKGQDIVVLDMRKVTPLYDYFVIATGASRRQVHAICEDVDEALRKVGDTRMGIEGYEASKWVVQDYGDVMLHVFDPDTRAYYTLEELWNDAKKVDWEAPEDEEVEEEVEVDEEDLASVEP